LKEICDGLGVFLIYAIDTRKIYVLAAKGQVNCHCCQSDEVKYFAKFQNKNRVVRRFRCQRCGKTFSEQQPLDGLRVDFKQAAQVVHLLCEGMGVRAIERFTRLNRRTILGILETAGEKCAMLLDSKIRDLAVESVQCDELYSFCFCKEPNNKLKQPEIGEQYTYLAVDRTSKLILTHRISKRTSENTDDFMQDLRKRVKSGCQLTTDGFRQYFSAVNNAFGQDVHFAQQTKVFAASFPMPKRLRHELKPQGVMEVRTKIRTGNPDPSLISTSHVERTNLSVRLFNRRYTRLTLGYSKKLENLKHSTALLIGFFNFCRVHSAHGKTPAQAAGLTDKTWTIEDLLSVTI
jgi:transposase-like protein/IS1 family transposase